MHKLISLRKLYKDVYVVELANGRIVPWRVLSVKEYLKFFDDYNRNFLPPSAIEDEIFRLCVLDETFVSQMEYLPAGTITAIVSSIWETSCPDSLQRLTNDLNMARHKVLDPKFKVLHDIVLLVFTAFPSYKLEEIYEMDYETLMVRLALAEKRLLEVGYLEAPISFDPVEKQAPVKSKAMLEAHQRWLESEGFVEPNQESKPIVQKNVFIKESTAVPEKEVSPILTSKPFLTSDGLKKERMKQEETIGGYDLVELPFNRAQMIKDAQVIYKDVLEALEKKRAAAQE